MDLSLHNEICNVAKNVALELHNVGWITSSRDGAGQNMGTYLPGGRKVGRPSAVEVNRTRSRNQLNFGNLTSTPFFLQRSRTLQLQLKFRSRT